MLSTSSFRATRRTSGNRLTAVNCETTKRDDDGDQYHPRQQRQQLRGLSSDCGVSVRSHDGAGSMFGVGGGGGCMDDDNCSVNSFGNMIRSSAAHHGSGIVFVLLLLLGAASGGAFIGIGISGAIDEQVDEFERSVGETIGKIQISLDDYAYAASLTHSRFRHGNFTRDEFRGHYEYLIANGLRVKAVQYVPNVTHNDRTSMEGEARAYYSRRHPEVTYRGFVGYNDLNSMVLEPRTQQPFYFPIHFMEPIQGNEADIDFDYYSSESRIRAVRAMFDTQQPSLTDRLTLVEEGGTISRCGDHDGPSYGVVLMHPGINLTTQPDVWPRDFTSIVLCVPDLLRKSTDNQGESSSVYIHDLSHPSGEPVFMGAARVDRRGGSNDVVVTFLEETGLGQLSDARLYRQSDVGVANRVWKITVVALDGTYEPDIVFVILGGITIFLASVFLALWVTTKARRASMVGRMKSEAEAERAALVLESARRATKTERELNDFIAHEVRNPVAAAMIACNFIKTAVSKPQPLQDEESRDLAMEDINIIDNALSFINDLLRNMLDMHRASNKQLQVDMAPTDLFHDVLEPVRGMLHRRGSKVKMLLDCPRDLFIMTDRLRLKQVVLNLGRNSTKFIEEGFIRLKAEVVDGMVRVYVDDSGTGIPEDKRKRLFTKFQESLDALSQGTGIGLFLCKQLIELMGGEIYLDDGYDSGVPGNPGTRFVLNLRVPPMEYTPATTDDLNQHLRNRSVVDDDDDVNNTNNNSSNNNWNGTQYTDEDTASIPTLPDLPATLTVLFVDDDSVLRKLFTRSLRMLAPGWVVREAANGEAALRLAESDRFDLIFVDQYMASTEKQLLGTETVSALRGQGVKCRICGLSANDKEAEFMQAGADAFMFKPFPCRSDALTQALCRILYQD